MLAATAASAADPVAVQKDELAIDLTGAVTLRGDDGGRIQVSTAPGADGIVRRIEVPARESQGYTRWAIFALANDSDEQLDRLIVAPHFQLAGSGIMWPDLGASRLAAITPSEGFAPERQASAEADVFAITLDPGSVVTFVAELRTDTLPAFELWEPNAYKDSVNAYTLYRGIVLGIAGLLALVLTILFVVKGSMMFPAIAALAWAVLAYLCIDFSFWNEILGLDPGEDQFYRAASEVMIALTLVVFLYAYLHLNRWHVRYSHVAIISLLVLTGLLGVAVYDPSIASGIARMALAALGVLGFVLIVTLSLRGYDRAIMLVPTWLLFLAWLAGTGLTVNGQLTSEIAQPALAGGLVLLVLLLGFTVMQHAFAGGVIAEGVINDQERRALALTGAGDVVWDWDVGRDRIHTSGEAEHSLGFRRGALEGPARDWLEVLHPRDRDRFRATLDAVVEQRRGRISQTFRLRTEDGHYLWYLLRARPILGTDGEVVRCVGTLVDVTDTKTAQERLLHDAVNDNLTGLPNRELFLDRLAGAITRCQADETLRPSVFLLDLDRFRQINESLGIPVGDSILLTVARRLGRILKPLDTLGRVEGDQFGIILSSESAPDRVAAFADALRRAIRAPITFSDREIFLTASVGIVMVDRTAKDQNDVLKDAELAMAYAKRAGGDRIETFRPSLRSTANDALAFEEDLRRALERDEMKVLFQPILRLEDRAIAGYEALLRWDHPKRGRVSPVDFIPVAERSGQIVDLGLFALDRAARQLSAWQQITGRESLFVSVNISSRQLVRHELINDVKAILTRAALPTGTLKLELTESIVMENPEFASQILQRLRELGAGLALDDFGTGYSSLAYLQRFPFDTIKIDQSFLRGTGGKRSVILKTMIDLAHDLEMDVVVEGVETEADVQTLTNDGAEFGQGFLLGKPMSADEVTTALEKKPVKVKA